MTTDTINTTKTHPTGSICIVWEIADVKEIRPDLSDEQCVEVLEYCRDEHNAELGINWTVIRVHADHLFPEPGEDEE